MFSPSESAGDIAQFVFDNWPSEWEEEAVSSVRAKTSTSTNTALIVSLFQVSKAEILRLIYQGRFLHGNVTLSALGLPGGKTTVMHLVPRESLPEPSSQDDLNRKKSGRSRCCGAMTCSIL